MSNPKDLCACGDFRDQHSNDGPCMMNDRPGFDLCHGGTNCLAFRLSQPADKANRHDPR